MNQGMRRLSDLVGPIQPFDLGMLAGETVVAGHVVVVLKNGRPIRALTPGKYRKGMGLGLPAFGTLMKVNISTEEVVLHLSVSNLATSCAYAVPMIDFQVGFRINDTAGFDQLLAYITSRGVNFGETLTPELTQEFDNVARWVVRHYTHEDLYAQGNIQPLFVGQANTPFLHGLFTLTRVLQAIPTWNQEFVSIREMEAKTRLELEEIRKAGEVEQARRLAELANKSVDGELSRADDEQLIAHAQRMGVSTAEVSNPELLAMREQMKADLAAELIRNARDVRGGDPAMIQALLGTIGGIGAPAGAPAGVPAIPPALPPGAYGAPPPALPAGEPASYPPPSAEPPHSSPHSYSPPPPAYSPEPPSAQPPEAHSYTPPAPPPHAYSPEPPSHQPPPSRSYTPPVPPPAAHSQAPPSPTGAPTGSSPALSAAPSLPTPQLIIDAALLTAVERAAGRVDGQWGIGSASAAGRTVVLVVCPQQRVPGLTEAIHQEIAPDLGLGGEVVVVANQASLRRLIGEYLAVRMRGQLRTEDVVDTRIEAGRLIVTIDHGDGRFGPLRRHLVAPEALVLPPLEAVLPFDAIDVESAMGQ